MVRRTPLPVTWLIARQSNPSLPAIHPHGSGADPGPTTGTFGCSLRWRKEACDRDSYTQPLIRSMTMMPDQFAIDQPATDLDITIDARAVAPLLGLSPGLFMSNLRRGMIAQLTERGVDEDAGLYRVTFHHGSRCCRIVVNPQADTISPA